MKATERFVAEIMTAILEARDGNLTKLKVVGFRKSLSRSLQKVLDEHEAKIRKQLG